MGMKRFKFTACAVTLLLTAFGITYTASAEEDYSTDDNTFVGEEQWTDEENEQDINENQNGWHEEDGRRFYLSDGIRCTGYNVIEGKEYYFAANGVMKTGWYTINGVRMFFSFETGERMLEWIDYNGNKFYLTQSGKTEGMCEIGGKNYYFDSCGILQEGWFEYDGSKYYSTFDDGIYCGQRTINGITYNFSSKGRFKDGWQEIDDKRVFYDYQLAEPVYGWINYNENIYYSDENYGKLTGDQTIDGCKYRFSGQGYMELGFQRFSDGTRYYDRNGKIAVDWLTFENQKYYFDKNGIMQTGLKSISGKNYYFNNSGAMQTGWQTIGGRKYYFGTSGAAANGLSVVDNKHYYFSNGVMQTGWQTISGGKYYFDKNGIMQTGLCLIDGKHYYFNEDDYGYWGGYSSIGQLVVNEPRYYIYTMVNGRYTETVLRIDKNGVALTEDDLLNKVKGKSKTSFTIQNIQSGYGGVSKSYLSDSDVKTLKKFADKNFKKGMSGAEKVKTTLEWIHYNTKYARDNDWAEISGCSFTDAIFNHKKGQCAQYNGALVAMMNWLGYDAKLVCGYRTNGTRKWQHYWGEVVIDGVIYIMETGNYGSDGSWRYFLTELAYTGGYVH